MRKKPRANPLVSRKAGPKPGAQPNAGSQNGMKPSTEERRKLYDGWSEPPPAQFTDIAIMTTKKALLDGIRYHMMKFSQAKMGDKPIDPSDQDDFARPVTLHRRDARQPPPGRAPKIEAPEVPQVDEQEAERLAQMKAEREAQRAVDQAKIAPVAKEVNPKRPKKQKEEKTNFNRAPKTQAAKKESELRYEEALPWHLEDAEGKNVWVGSYVAALSESNVAFMIDQSVFRMVPLEKWYRFTSKPPFQPFTIDEAEALMGKKVDVGRWVMKDEEKRAGRQDLEATRQLLYGRGPMVKTESATFKAASRSEKLEHDEIDMSGDEFQDDDEAPLFEKNDDEDTKDSKDRIRREQLGANLFGDGDEQEVDRELAEELKEEIERQKLGKATRKALIKRDREDIYESDNSEDNPWSSSVSTPCVLVYGRSNANTWISLMNPTPMKRRKWKRTRRMKIRRRMTIRRQAKSQRGLVPRAPILHPERSLRVQRRVNPVNAPVRQLSLNPVGTNPLGRSSRRLPRLLREAGLALLCPSVQPLSEWAPDPVATEKRQVVRCRMALFPGRRS